MSPMDGFLMSFDNNADGSAGVSLWSGYVLHPADPGIK